MAFQVNHTAVDIDSQYIPSDLDCGYGRSIRNRSLTVKPIYIDVIGDPIRILVINKQSRLARGRMIDAWLI